MRDGLRTLLIIVVIAIVAVAAVYLSITYQKKPGVPPPSVTTEAPAPAPAPGGTTIVERTPAPDRVDFCINYPGTDSAWADARNLKRLPNGECHTADAIKKMLAEQVAEEVKRLLAEKTSPPAIFDTKKGKGDIEITLPNFQSEFWRSGLIRILLIAGFVGAIWWARKDSGVRQAVAVVVLIVLGGILWLTFSSDPTGSWAAYLPKELDFSWVPSDLIIRNEVLLLVVFGGMVAIALKAMKTKNFFPVLAAVFLIGVVVMNWYGVIGADWWPLRDTTYGHRVVHDCWDPGPCAPAPEPLPAGWEYESDY